MRKVHGIVEYRNSEIRKYSKVQKVWKSNEIVSMACEVIIEKLQKIETSIKEQKIKIDNSTIAMKNCYDITLKNETYTIGKLLEYILHYEYLLNKKVSFYDSIFMIS